MQVFFIEVVRIKIALLILLIIVFIQMMVIKSLLTNIDELNYQIRTKDRQLNYHRTMNKGRL